jgi:DNA-binding CsgD family transcriptional regulator
LTAETTPREVGAAALAAPPRHESPPTIEDLVLDGFATRFAVGYRQAVPILREAGHVLCAESTPPAGLTRWSVFGSNGAADLWDNNGYRTILTRLEQAERARGALDSLRITLGTLGHSLMWAGDFAAAEAVHSEATEISVALGADTAIWEMLKVELFAWQGRDAEARAIAELLTGELAEASGAGVVVNLARIALAVLDLSRGRYEEALTNAGRVMQDDPSPHGSQALPEVVEAGARSGDKLAAASGLERLSERALASGTPWALGLLARSRALLSDEDPEPLYQEAIAHLAQTWVRTDLARARLLYGEWLQRQERLSDAREQLRVAYEMFERMGAAAFADRARIELAAAGERAPKRTAHAAPDLTAQERQVALLASEGMRNAEIAEKLFLSTSTIEYHLSKVYRKLGVGSRGQLARALAS